MKWYKFWKKSGPNQTLTESYVEVNDEWYPTDNDVKYVCEDWAETVGGGFNTHYSYGFKEVKLPPKNWLKKKIKNIESDISYQKDLLEHYQTLLRTKQK